jgi:hypothetical protein
MSAPEWRAIQVPGGAGGVCRVVVECAVDRPDFLDAFRGQRFSLLGREIGAVLSSAWPDMKPGDRIKVQIDREP